MSSKKTASPRMPVSGPRVLSATGSPTRGDAGDGKRVRTAGFLMLSALVVAVLAALVIVVVSFLSRLSPSDPVSLDSIAPTARPSAPSETTAPTAGCPAAQGDQATAQGVIAAFEHAYYVQRSGAAVRALVAPGAAFNSAEAIQRGIDSVPVGTTYCLTVTGVAPDTYSISLTEYAPGSEEKQYLQKVTTALVEGRVFIASVESVGEK
ncbi:hypothetical protein ACH47B_26310 [Rhodococcus sp. NPDC019627]|uniref:hypothetical protein n=1 Tax=unclassified Rhodococcus (in: high G+C Gram-positive bacteria) TaxID=192944 RepID=UPI0033CF7E22